MTDDSFSTELERGLIKSLGHHYRHHLVAIMDRSSLMMSNDDPLDFQLCQETPSIYSDAKAALETLDGLLSLVQLGSININLMPTDLAACLSYAQRKIALQGDFVEPTISINIPESLPYILGDSHSLCEALVRSMRLILRMNPSQPIGVSTETDADQMTLTILNMRTIDETRWKRLDIPSSEPERMVDLLTCLRIAKLCQNSVEFLTTDADPTIMMLRWTFVLSK